MRPHPLLLAILAALPACSETFETEGCLAVSEETKTCPTPDKVSLADLFLPNECGDDLELSELKGAGTLKDAVVEGGGPACCYPVEVIDHDPNAECSVGRPYYERGQLRQSPVHIPVPVDTRGTVNNDHAPLLARSLAAARAWAASGAGEHASVAAFNRLSLQLMALGAPVELLRDVQQAAFDEVNHAEACWRLAQELSGQDVEVGCFPFGQTIEAQTTLASLAYSAVREGCLAETLGACVADAAAPLAPDERVRRVLGQLARDEANHAVLSFRIVSWALQTGGAEVRAAVHAALAEPWPTLDAAELALRAGVASEEIEATIRDAKRRVLGPATRALAC